MKTFVAIKEQLVLEIYRYFMFFKYIDIFYFIG